MFDQVTLDGTGTSGDQAIVFKAEGEYNSLSVTNSEVKNYTKGFYYINVAANVKTITIDNNVISNIECNGRRLLRLPYRRHSEPGDHQQHHSLTTVCAARDFIRYDDASAKFAGVAPVITVDHNTSTAYRRRPTAASVSPTSVLPATARHSPTIS
jgi:hypothetical protein